MSWFPAIADCDSKKQNWNGNTIMKHRCKINYFEKKINREQLRVKERTRFIPNRRKGRSLICDDVILQKTWNGELKGRRSLIGKKAIGFWNIGTEVAEHRGGADFKQLSFHLLLWNGVQFRCLYRIYIVHKNKNKIK